MYRTVLPVCIPYKGERVSGSDLRIGKPYTVKTQLS